MGWRLLTWEAKAIRFASWNWSIPGFKRERYTSVWLQNGTRRSLCKCKTTLSAKLSCPTFVISLFHRRFNAPHSPSADGEEGKEKQLATEIYLKNSFCFEVGSYFRLNFRVSSDRGRCVDCMRSGHFVRDRCFVFFSQHCLRYSLRAWSDGVRRKPRQEDGFPRKNCRSTP